VRCLLKPGGIIHVAVRNAAYWEARLSAWASSEPYHLIYFDPRTLERTVTSAGLTSRTLTTHDSFSVSLTGLMEPPVIGSNGASSGLHS